MLGAAPRAASLAGLGLGDKLGGHAAREGKAKRPASLRDLLRAVRASCSLPARALPLALCRTRCCGRQHPHPGCARAAPPAGLTAGDPLRHCTHPAAAARVAPHTPLLPPASRLTPHFFRLRPPGLQLPEPRGPVQSVGVAGAVSAPHGRRPRAAAGGRCQQLGAAGPGDQRRGRVLQTAPRARASELRAALRCAAPSAAPMLLACAAGGRAGAHAAHLGSVRGLPTLAGRMVGFNRPPPGALQPQRCPAPAALRAATGQQALSSAPIPAAQRFAAPCPRAGSTPQSHTHPPPAPSSTTPQSHPHPHTHPRIHPAAGGAQLLVPAGTAGRLQLGQPAGTHPHAPRARRLARPC